MDQTNELFAVYAEAEGHERPLLQLDLTFARLMDDIVVPYQSDVAFFIDGAPVTASKLKRIKILRLTPDFCDARERFDRTLTRAEVQLRKVYGDQYTQRFEHVIRENSEDVTAQVIKAYDQAIKPKLKDYMPKRKELIAAAMQLFIEGIKALGR
ncbi:MAG: hypothetical protein WD793_09225 [Steroidobacteraceae bacterium]